jgi:gliding motility-associated-like protein
MNSIKLLFLLFVVFSSFFSFSQITVNYSNSSSTPLLQGAGGPSACDPGRFKLLQGPDIFNGCIRMTPPNFTDNTGAAWLCDPIDLDSSFRLTTSVTFGSNPAQGDGIVFVIKSTSNPNVFGGVGGNIGYHNPGPAGNPIGESLGIEFDSFNGGPGDTGDPCSHAQLVRNGDLTNKIGPQTCLLPGGANVNDGLTHDICISWDALNNVYRAYFDGALVINYSGNIRTFFANPNQVYWGFTAGDGAATNQNNHLICSTVMNISHATNRPAPNCAPCVPPTITGSLGVCSGSTTQLTGSGTPNATSPWTSSNPSVATVNSSGLVTGVSAGTSTITYTDDSGCFITATVTVNPLPVIGGATQVCIGLTANVTPGTGGTWTSSNTSVATITNAGVVTGVSAGTSTLTFTNTTTGCINTVLFTVNPTPVVTATPTSQTICSGTAPSIALTSNVAGTTFNWTVVQSGVTGATNGSGASVAQTLTATGTTAGTATYTITPAANGCPGTPINVVITVNPIPVVTATPTSQTICSGAAPSIALTSNVTGTTFSWTVVQSGVTGATNGSGASIAQTLSATGTTAGTATYTVTPTANGCPGVPIEVVITVNPTPIVTATPTSQIICSGATTAIDLTSNVTGTTFSWTVVQTGVTGATDASGATINQTLTTTGTTAGTATYTITPTANGCPGAPIQVIITVNPTPVVTATPTSQTICSGTAPSIALTSNVTGTTFSWTVVQSSVTGATNGSGASIAQTLTATGTTAGTATYTITPTANGCPGTPINVVITVNPIPVVTATPTSQTICSGTAPSIALTSNVAGTTFSWTVAQTDVIGATNGTGTSITETLTTTGTTTGTATYTITPTANGCPGPPVNVIITVNPTPVITPLANVLSCDSYTLPVITGTNLTGNQAYYTGPSGSGVQYNAGDVINFADFASYPVTLYIFDQTGTTPNCLDQEFFQLTIVPTPVLAPVANVAVCNTFTFPAIIGTNLTNTEAYFTGPNGTGTSFLPGQTFNTVGTTTIYIYDATGTTPNCFDEESFELTINPLPVIAGVGQDPSVCNATDGQIEVTLTSGNTSLGSLTWTGAASGTNPTADITLDSPDIDNLGAGSYNVTFTDANGCVSNTVNVALNNPGAPIINPISDYSSCNVDYELLLSNVTGTNLTANLAFYDAPDGPAGTGNVIADGTIFTAPTNITVYVYDENGSCDAEIQFQVEINENPTATISPDPAVACFGTAISLNGNPIGGSGVYSTNFWTGNTAIINNPNVVNPNTLVSVAAGTYNLTYTVTDDNGCIGSDDIEVVINPTPAVAASNNGPLCDGLDFTLNETGGDATSWSWASLNGSATFNDATLQSPNVSNAVDGEVFQVTITDVNGCTNNASTSVTVFPLPVVTPSNNSPVCIGEDITLNETGGVATSWAWTSLNGTASFNDATIQSPIVSNAVNGEEFQVTVSDANGCSSVLTTIVTVNPLPSVSPTNNGAICAGQNVTLNETAGDATSWSWTSLNGAATFDNASIQSPTVSNAVNGEEFQVVVTDINGCSDSLTTIITVNPLPVVTPTSDSPICQGDNLILNETGGASVSWSWSIVSGIGSFDNANIQSPTVSNASNNDEFQVDVIDANGCANSATIIVVVNPLPNITVSNNGPICASDDIILNETGGNATSWNWVSLNGAAVFNDATLQSPSASNAANGEEFQVSITDANGCAQTASTIVTVVASPILDPIGPISACESFLLPAITGVDLTGNQAYFNDTQANGGTVVTGTITSSTTLYMFDGASGCSDEVQVVITINELPNVTSITGDGSYCEDEVAENVLVDVTGTADWIIYYTLNGVADAVVSSTSPFNLGNLEGTYILDSIADNNCSNNVNGSVVIFFKPTPGVPSAGNDSEYCSTVDFADMFANGAGGTMTWYTDLLLTEIFGTGNAIQPANQVGATSYYVTETIDGCEGPSNEVVITIENCDIILPTAFTPDDDGNNDTWEIPLLDEAYPNNVVYVYNRWGSLIFEHNSQDNGPYNANQWDGTYNGNPLPVGSYFFVIDFNNAAQESATGAVSIILN